MIKAANVVHTMRAIGAAFDEVPNQLEQNGARYVGEFGLVREDNMVRLGF
jgi:hypothetical protein